MGGKSEGQMNQVWGPNRQNCAVLKMNPTDLLVDQMSVSQGDSPVQGSQPVGSGLGSSILPEFHLNCQLDTQIVGSIEGRLQQVEVRSSKSGVMNSVSRGR